VALFFFTRPALAKALGPFLSPLATVVDLALLLCAMSLTGGSASPYALLLPVGLALSWHCDGPGAARFFAVSSVMGVAALVGLGGEPMAGPDHLFAMAATALSAPALLAALEAFRSASSAAAAPETRPEVSLTPAPVSIPAAPSERNREAEILHDLRSPLSVMRVYADLIGEAARRGELPSADYLSNLSRELELAERLIGEPPGRSQPNPPGTAVAPETAAAAATADLVEILGSLATAYRLSHEGRLRIEFIAERPQLPVAADPVALQRAFRNVLENAVRYTPEGGEIRIRAGAAGPHAFVVVKDTGVGMSPEDRQRAFDYAFRGSAALGTRGKGLGLAVTKEILESNGGKISLSSEAGYGSEVTILIPFQRGARA
jgi:signal transduction histidine kinase